MFPGLSDAGSHLRHMLFRYDALRSIAPRGDAEYDVWLAVRSRDLVAYNQLYALLAPSLLLCAGLCLLRVAFVRGVLMWADAGGGFSGRSSSTATAKGGEVERPGATVAGAEKDGANMATPGAAAAADLELRWAEGFWTATGGTVLLVWSWRCVVTSNGGCPGLPGLLDTSTCLAGWPLLPVEPAVRRYYSAELAWYLHLLLKHRLGVGLHDSGLMVAHHVATVYLLLLSYCFSLTRAGVLLLALLNLSSPLLHVSKIAHAAGLKRLALVSFASFAAVFAASRVVLFPLIFLPLGLVSSQRHIGRLLQLYPLTFGIVNTLLVALVAMQWGWFVAIVRIIRHAASGDTARLARSAAHMEAAAAAAAARDSSQESSDAAVVVARHSQGYAMYASADAAGSSSAGVAGEGGCAAVAAAAADGGAGGRALIGSSTGGSAAGDSSSAGLAGSAAAAAEVGRCRPAVGPAAAFDAAAGRAAVAATAAARQEGTSSEKQLEAGVTGHAWQVHASSGSGAATAAVGPRAHSEPLIRCAGGSCGETCIAAAVGRAVPLSSCGMSDGAVAAGQQRQVVSGSTAATPQSPERSGELLSRTPPGLRLRA